MTLQYPLLDLINLKPNKAGNMSIERESYDKGKEFIVISLRTHVLTGQRPAKCIAAKSGTIHRLKEKNRGIWMSDLPCEIYQHAEFVPKLRGNVLIGGLGLGLILQMMAQTFLHRFVKSVTIVEKSKDIIKLIKPQLNLPFKTTIINKDLFKYLKTCKRKFDTAYYDIWSGDNGMVWKQFIKPLRDLSRGIVAQKNLYCWQESVIKSQISRTGEDKNLLRALKKA